MRRQKKAHKKHEALHHHPISFKGRVKKAIGGVGESLKQATLEFRRLATEKGALRQTATDVGHKVSELAEKAVDAIGKTAQQLTRSAKDLVVKKSPVEAAPAMDGAHQSG